MPLAPRLLTLALVATLLVPGPAAATLYRTVGPDGKVTFSDRRPNDAQSQTRELGKGPQFRPLFTPGLPLFETHEQAATSARRLRAPPADGLAATPARSGRPFAPGLPDALLIVTGHRFFVQVLLESCVHAAPDGMERYQIAVRNWRDRNAAVFDQADRITFAEFSGEQRDQLRYAAQERLLQVLPRDDAGAAERHAWCDRSAMELSTRRHELTDDPRVAPVLESVPR